MYIDYICLGIYREGYKVILFACSSPEDLPSILIKSDIEEKSQVPTKLKWI